MRLQPWKLSGQLTAFRTVGEARLVRNGSFVDIWLRVNGKEQWYRMLASDLANVVPNDTPHGKKIKVVVESDGNAEVVQRKVLDVIYDERGTFTKTVDMNCPRCHGKGVTIHLSTSIELSCGCIEEDHSEPLEGTIDNSF